MLDRIEKSTKKEQETQRNLFEALLAQNRAEMLAYRSQINPHFLFNTLECMRSMAQYYNAPPLADLITSMSSMFRYSLNSGVTSLLEVEVNHLANYLNIMSARFSQRFLLKVLMEENTKYARCLSMILQPLAENAIIHAFTGYNKDVPCYLCVQTKMDKENQQLVIRLTDNGRGMVPEEVEALNIMMRQPEDNLQAHKDSIGLPNIFKRLKLAYGNHCHLRIRSKLNYYTSITIIIPQEALHNFPEC
jgi:two-component system sensor histidine kinase YesM